MLPRTLVRDCAASLGGPEQTFDWARVCFRTALSSHVPEGPLTNMISGQASGSEHVRVGLVSFVVFAESQSLAKQQLPHHPSDGGVSCRGWDYWRGRRVPPLVFSGLPIFRFLVSLYFCLPAGLKLFACDARHGFPLWQKVTVFAERARRRDVAYAGHW